MMSERFFTRKAFIAIIAAVLPFVFCAGLSFASSSKPTNPQAQTKTGALNSPAFSLGKKGPVIITAKSLSADSKSHEAVFEGSVKAKTDNMKIFADKMIVLYGAQGGIESIEATGAVRLVKEGRVITAGRADYTRADDKIIFSQSPKVAEGDTVITGTTIVYFVSDDRTNVTDSKVMIQGK